MTSGPDMATADPRHSSGAANRPPRIGMVSLGCPKALVDSERIMTRLRSEGYVFAPGYDSADLVLVNTCGFIDSAKAESLDAIAEGMSQNGRVIVTGCLGVEGEMIRERHPGVLAVTGPHQYEQVVSAVHDALPPLHDPFVDLVPEAGLKLTPRHYAYLKISEGCNHKCRFCIIPSLRGRLVSRPIHDVVAEAERLKRAGVKELLVISQDTSAYGLDLRHATSRWRGREMRSHITDLATELGELGIWVRLHYVYPYPHVDQLMPLMADGKILPYLDIPFQHAHPRVLSAMRRPADQVKQLDRILAWRQVVPDLTLRSTFIVGFPGETEEEFQFLLDWLQEAQLDRVGCFMYEPVEGATANDLPDPVPKEVQQERWHRFMETQTAISAAKLQAKIGHEIDVLIDEVDPDGATGRSSADAPEIDGTVLFDDPTGLSVGDLVRARVTDADEVDLFAERLNG